MRIAVSGASGLVGSALVQHLTANGHSVLPMVRRRAEGDHEIEWNADPWRIEKEKLEELDGVVHLAGENIGGKRWNEEQKRRLRESRIGPTRQLALTLAALDEKPGVLVVASAVGYYGDRGDEELTEQSAAGSGFLADLCREWEDATSPAREAGIRVVNARLGVVLDAGGGALAKMLTPFKMGVGGVMGSGSQYMSWVALDDVVGAIDHVLEKDELQGPVNLVAPNAVDNRSFTKELGKVLGRWTIFPMPAFAARLVLGEMAEELLLSGQKVKPEALNKSGYTFRFPELEPALRHAL